MIACTKRVACFAALGVMALSSAAQEVYQDNVVIVLDSSGSMRKSMRSTGTPRMDAAKSALKAVLQQVPKTTHIGLLVFSARNVENDWLYRLGPRDDAALLASVDLPQPGGGTPLGRYMKIAADRLLEERQKQYGYGTYRLLVVTDGQASDTHRVEKFTPEIMARGITVDVIGVDMGERHTLATKVHSYRSADDPDSLKQAVQDVFAEISSDTATDTDADAFDVIAGIPSEAAEIMLVALAKSGNYPIGSQPAQQVRANQQTDDRRAQQSPSPRSAPGKTDQSLPQDDDEGGGFPVWQIAVLVIIVILAITRGNRRNRKRRR